MNDKKKTNDKNKPEHIVRHGEAMASISLRQSNGGYQFYDISLNRCWNSLLSGKEVHGNTFFEKHEEDIIHCIREAAAWIRTKLSGNPSQNETETPSQVREMATPANEE